MKRKVLVALFFVVVFVLPIVWYLFLQIFGENKFDLPRLRQWEESCTQISGPTLLLDSKTFDKFPNELRRIRRKMNSQDVIELQEITDKCVADYDFYLIDEDGWVRGEFQASREEVDRLMAEIDIYLLNKKNESSNQFK